MSKIFSLDSSVFLHIIKNVKAGAYAFGFFVV